MPQDVRALVAIVVWGSTLPGPAGVLADRLTQVQQYLQKFEAKVNVRAVWLAWHAIARLAGNDSLALARARDRLLERLIADGLSPERDLPGFLRTAGHRDADRRVRGIMGTLYHAAVKWCENGENVFQSTNQYLDLVFAFGLARLGNVEESRRLVKKAEAIVEKKVASAKVDDYPEVHVMLLSAFRYRIDQVNLGRQHLGPLPEDWRDQLDRLMPHDRKGNQQQTAPRYVVERLREKSLILDPVEKLDPYMSQTVVQGGIAKQLVALHSMKDGRQLQSSILTILRESSTKSGAVDQEMKLLKETILLSPRVGESFVVEMLQRVDAILDRAQSTAPDMASLETQAALLNHALLLSSSYDKAEFVHKLVRRFLLTLQLTKQGRGSNREIGPLFGQTVRCLRKMDLRDEIEKLIGHTSNLVFEGRSLAELRASKSDQEWGWTLMSLIPLAGVWLSVGWLEKANEVLVAVRDLLYSTYVPKDQRSNRIFPDQYTRLVCTYVTALAQAPIEIASKQLEEMFDKMWKLQYMITSGRYYAILHFRIIEAVVLAIVSDDFALGPGARRWLEDDEYLVRRRLHRDHRAMLHK